MKYKFWRNEFIKKFHQTDDNNWAFISNQMVPASHLILFFKGLKTRIGENYSEGFKTWCEKLEHIILYYKPWHVTVCNFTVSTFILVWNNTYNNHRPWVQRDVWSKIQKWVKPLRQGQLKLPPRWATRLCTIKPCVRQNTENLWLRRNASAFGQSLVLDRILKTFGFGPILQPSVSLWWIEAVMCTVPVMNPT